MRPRRFKDVIATQLDLFEQEQVELVRSCEAAEDAYDSAPREEAEERYADYLDLIDGGTELLVEMREAYAGRLEEDAALDYEAAFNRAVKQRLPRFALEIGDS